MDKAEGVNLVRDMSQPLREAVDRVGFREELHKDTGKRWRWRLSWRGGLWCPRQEYWGLQTCRHNTDAPHYILRLALFHSPIPACMVEFGIGQKFFAFPTRVNRSDPVLVWVYLLMETVGCQAELWVDRNELQHLRRDHLGAQWPLYAIHREGAHTHQVFGEPIRRWWRRNYFRETQKPQSDW